MLDHVLRHLSVLAIDVLRLTIWLVLLVAIFVPLERLFTLRPARIWRPQIGVDLAWYFLNSLLPAAIIALPLSILASLLHGLDPLGFYSAVGRIPFWWRVLLMLLVSDLGAYAYHRLSHHTPFLWRFHAIHHSAEHVDWLVNTRAHPVDIVFTRLAGLVPIYLLGLARVTDGRPDPGVALVVILGTIWTFFIHANVHWRFGPLEWLVSTPAFHHWHHTNDEHRDRNFASLFPFIDRIFGTAWLPRHWPPVYGIDAKMPSTLHGQLLDPIAPPRPSNLTASPPGTLPPSF
jgi:sterol desaturase/sphingolipid hydroxylase (fatty acid hydroxylase superfamily)